MTPAGTPPTTHRRGRRGFGTASDQAFLVAHEIGHVELGDNSKRGHGHRSDPSRRIRAGQPRPCRRLRPSLAPRGSDGPVRARIPAAAPQCRCGFDRAAGEDPYLVSSTGRRPTPSPPAPRRPHQRSAPNAQAPAFAPNHKAGAELTAGPVISFLLAAILPEVKKLGAAGCAGPGCRRPPTLRFSAACRAPWIPCRDSGSRPFRASIPRARRH